jgi:hypothetical protein
LREICDFPLAAKTLRVFATSRKARSAFRTTLLAHENAEREVGSADLL